MRTKRKTFVVLFNSQMRSFGMLSIFFSFIYIWFYNPVFFLKRIAGQEKDEEIVVFGWIILYSYSNDCSLVNSLSGFEEKTFLSFVRWKGFLLVALCFALPVETISFSKLTSLTGVQRTNANKDVCLFPLGLSFMSNGRPTRLWCLIITCWLFLGCFCFVC